MKAFRYNLERILSLRKYREREWEAKLAEVTGACISINRDIEGDFRRKASELNERFTRSLGVEALEVSNLYVARLEQQINQNAEKLRYEEERREEVKKMYLEAQRDRKVLDKLKERKEAAYIREARLEEIAEIDDMNSRRSLRPKNVGESGG